MFNWSSISHIFQIPLSWFRDVDKRSWIIGDDHIKVNRSADGTELQLETNGLEVSKEIGEEPTEILDDGGDEVVEDDVYWDAGGENGLLLDCYFKAEDINGYHYLRRARLTFSVDGLLKHMEIVKNEVEIQA